MSDTTQYPTVEDHEELCAACNGSGSDFVLGGACFTCGGSGLQAPVEQPTLEEMIQQMDFVRLALTVGGQWNCRCIARDDEVIIDEFADTPTAAVRAAWERVCGKGEE